MVEYETRGRVAILTLNRPEARNAVSGAVASGIEAGIDRLEEDGEVWAGVVAANGPVFSAGADLKLIASGGLAGMETDRGGLAGGVGRGGAGGGGPSAAAPPGGSGGSGASRSSPRSMDPRWQVVVRSPSRAI